MNTQTKATDSITIPEAPAIPGLTFHHFRGESDYANMVAVIQGSAKEDQIERVDSVENVRTAYQHLTNCDPDTDMVFVEIDGEVVGYSRVWWWQEDESRQRIYSSFGFLLPEWRRKGIGRAVLRYDERRLRAIASDHPQDGERFFHNAAADTEVSATALILSEGYQATSHHALMVRPDLENIQDAPLPEGLEVRPVIEEHFRPIWEAHVEAFRDHLEFSSDMEDFEQFLDDPYRNPALWRIGWDGEQVAGQVRSFIRADENEEYNRKRGWTEDISVRRPWRRRGLARALLCRSLQAVKDAGMEEAALTVHTGNITGAFQLYESVGFRVVKIYTEYRKPMS